MGGDKERDVERKVISVEEVNDLENGREIVVYCAGSLRSSHTVTVTITKASPTPTHESDHISCPVRNDRRRHNQHHHDYDNDHCTVTCTPTTTQYSTPTPKCCEAPGGPGFQNKAHTIDPLNVVVIPNIASDIDCCKACFDKPECIQWAFFSGQCSSHENKVDVNEICANPVVDTGAFFSAGIVRCSDD
ncbi:9004_t:CDS:2, partial [Funneliformis mosseae]